MFGFHPANLAFRFLLEMAALIAIGVGVYRLGSGLVAWLLALVIPVAAAAVWGVFNVPGDASRSGGAPVPVPGTVRLLVELAVMSMAVGLLWRSNQGVALVLAVAVVVHYWLSIDRIRWLLAR